MFVDTKVRQSSLPGDSTTQLTESTHVESGLGKMTQSAANLVDMGPVQHTAGLRYRPPKVGFKLMNKTFREDPRGAQDRNETGGPSSSDEEPKVGYWPMETRAESPTQIGIPAVIGFFLDHLSSVSFAYLCSPALLSHAVV